MQGGLASLGGGQNLGTAELFRGGFFEL